MFAYLKMQSGLSVVSFSFSLTLSFPVSPAARLTARLTGKRQITTLQCVEFRRTRLDAQFLRKLSPALPVAALVRLEDDLRLLVRHLAELEDHKGIGRGRDALDDGVHLRQGNSELGAQLDVEIFHVCLGLHVHAPQKTVQICIGNGSETGDEYNERHCKTYILHDTTSLN